MHLLLWLLFGLHVMILDIHAADENRPINQEILGKNERLSLRWYRSVSVFAKPVIKAFINSAVEVPTRSQKFRKLIKQGSVSNAIADFKQLKPTNVKEGKYSTVISSGGLNIMFRLRDHSNKHMPTIQISDPNGASSFKIFYRQTP